MDVRRISETYPNFNKGINWSSFSHTAQANYAFARIALQSFSPSIAITLSHQMIELFLKASILHSVCEEDYSKYEPIRKQFGHNSYGLLNSYAAQIPVFAQILSDENETNFIKSVGDCYIDARYGEIVAFLYGEDCEILDRIFLKFIQYMY